MASRKKHYAKCKVWGESVTSEMEGPVRGVAIEVFSSIESDEDREYALEKIQDFHQQALAANGKGPLPPG